MDKHRKRRSVSTLGAACGALAGLLALGALSAAQAACTPPVAVNISSLTPSGGNAGGGYSVAINGSNLSNTTSVQFGGVNASIQSNTGSKITVTAPAKPGGGTASVVLFGDFGQNTSGASCVNITSYTSPISFTYVVTAVVISSSPALLAQVGLAYTQSNSASGGNGNITFSVASGSLPAGTSLNTNSGLVSGTPTTAGAFSYSITATDSPVSTPATGPTISGTVNPPALAVVATPSSTTQVGQAYSQANVASGGTAPYVYSVASGTLPAGTSLNTSTGLVSGTPTAAGFFSYSIGATDSSSPAETASSLSVGGTIGNAAISLGSTPSAQTQVAQPYSQANTASGGSGLYTYTLNSGSLPAGTSLNPNTGLVSGTPTTAGAFSYTILVTDSTNATGSSSVSGTISGQGFTLTSTASTVTQVGQSYSQTNVASFGTPGYSYAVTAGSVPAGTTLNTSTGTVSGTPTTVGAFSYTVTATDSNGVPQTASQVISGTMAPPVLTIASAPSAQTRIGQPYSQTNTASGGTPAYTYSLYAGALPVGTTLNPATGVVSGTPATQGLFYYSILVTDSGSPQQTATSTTVSGVIATSASAITLTSSANPSTFGHPVTFTATVTAGATGTVTFKDSGATLGTATIAANQASLTTSSLSLGDHSITAVYSGDATYSASTSAALKQTVAVPSDSTNVRAMQVAGTQMAAGMSAQAISGALENAIADGFGDGGSPFASNGSGFTLNYAALERQSGNAASPDRAMSFAPPADGKPSKFDDAFSALAYQAKGAKSQARAIAPEREWLPWVDVRGMNVDRRATGSDLKGSQLNVLAGITRKLTPQILVGAFGGYEYSNFTSDALNGRLKGGGWTAGAYFGWKFNPASRFDLTVARTAINYNSSAGSASASIPGSRWLASGGFTALGTWQGFQLEPSLRLYAMWEYEKAYTDSLGIAQAERNFASGRLSAGNKFSYRLALSDATIVTPYVGIYGDYYASRDDASDTAVAPAPLMQGFSARVTGGVGIGIGSALISAGGEYGGIGSNTQIWTWRARGTVPF